MKRSLIYERVLEHIKSKIADGSLKPGDRLWTVASLSEQLGAGQAAVREAYRILELMGVLEVTQGRGTYVSAHYHAGPAELEVVERESFLHTLQARKLIEPELAALAAKNATQAEIDAILSAAAELEQLYREGKDFIEPDVAFHDLIFRAGHNPVLVRMLATVKDELLDSRRVSTRLAHATEKAIAFHRLIAYSIKDRNIPAARALMLQHIEDVEHDWQATQGVLTL